MDKLKKELWIFLLLFVLGTFVFKISGDYAIILTDERAAYGLDNPSLLGWDLWILWRINWLSLLFGVIGLFGVLIKASVIKKAVTSVS